MRRLFLPLVLLAAGCVDVPRGPAGAEIVDSAAVRLVKPAPMEDWYATAGTTELLRIGTLGFNLGLRRTCMRATVAHTPLGREYSRISARISAHRAPTSASGAAPG